MTQVTADVTGSSRERRLKRWLPLLALAAALIAFYVGGFQHYLSFESFVAHESQIKAFVAGNLVAAVLIYMVFYVGVVALSLPGAAIMSIAGGFLFGWMLSAPVTVVAATFGAVIVFAAVKTSFGAVLAERAGPMVQKLSRGFAEDAFNYLLFLRLVPVFPFFVVNAVAGICNLRLRTFVSATVLGIVPGAIAFAYLGTGLGSVLEGQRRLYDTCVAANGSSNCSLSFDPSALVTRELLLAFAAMGAMALLPVVLRKFRKSTAGG